MQAKKLTVRIALKSRKTIENHVAYNEEELDRLDTSNVHKKHTHDIVIVLEHLYYSQAIVSTQTAYSKPIAFNTLTKQWSHGYFVVLYLCNFNMKRKRCVENKNTNSSGIEKKKQKLSGSKNRKQKSIKLRDGSAGLSGQLKISEIFGVKCDQHTIDKSTEEARTEDNTESMCYVNLLNYRSLIYFCSSSSW